ncbi:hypothetical protein O6H91_Y241600 [Diphasiastrum complanatum]|nr:hypothetical protein O6H91_Y241600 [Diphasiastrum complanatum]
MRRFTSSNTCSKEDDSNIVTKHEWGSDLELANPRAFFDFFTSQPCVSKGYVSPNAVTGLLLTILHCLWKSTCVFVLPRFEIIGITRSFRNKKEKRFCLLGLALFVLAFVVDDENA